ncbi:unnamed protein product [marine sediment metagenome]|uniref:Uncharacterized protein n=1 Tax=marine sediment metagenome TaxID=412755 RepID=X1L9C4_9ZZZZ
MVKITGAKAGQVTAIKSLILRCKQDIPKDALYGLIVNFGTSEGLFLPGEKQEVFYSVASRTIFLKPNSTEYDFYHELSHHLDVVAGRSDARHAAANRFAHKWGIPRRKI